MCIFFCSWSTILRKPVFIGIAKSYGIINF
nr:MAG TPA: hypothetical protein [Caudoviricetes sp.]